MTQEEFNSLVSRLEPFAEQHPQVYKLYIAGLAGLGYGYIVLVLFFLALLLLFTLAIMVKATLLGVKLAIPLFILIGVILRALWVRLQAPTGIPLKRRDAPELFHALDDMRRQLKGPRIHKVLLTDDFNAAVSQIPRLGLFGWQKNYLILGLPLMRALSPDQFRAVLAHEYGHLAGAHSRFSCWIYRVRQTWNRLLGALHEKTGWGISLFNRFFDWYIPFFNAYTFVLARANEYYADRCSAQLTNARTAADALTNVAIRGSFFDQDFWRQIYQNADNEPAPAFGPYTVLPECFHRTIAADDASRWLSQALEQKTSSLDTHPSLHDRLSALNQEARIPQVITETAAQCYLGTHLQAVTEQLDKHWTNRVESSWRERYEYVQEARKKLAILNEKALATKLELQEAWDQARWTEEFISVDKALAFYQALINQSPQEAAPHFAVGRILLARADAAGHPSLERAMDLDVSYTQKACEFIYYYLYQQGRTDEAQKYYQRALKYQHDVEAAKAERAQLTLHDKFLPHALEAQALNALCEQLCQHARIKKAYLVRKQVQHFPEQALYILGIAYGHWFSSKKSAKNLVQLLIQEMQFPGETFVLIIDRTDNQVVRKLGKQLRKYPQSQIYQR